MVAFILPANSASGGYEIENSVRFNDDDSAALSITPSSASTSRTKWTWSGWIKRGEVPTDDNNDYSRIFNVKADGNNYIISGFLYSDGFNVTAREGNTEVLKFEPSRKFRDYSAWYHIVMAYDSTQGTARNRFRVYFNGEEDTTALATTPDQNTELVVLEDVIHNIGRDNHGTAYYYDGYMADVYLIDGTQYAASDFGETNDNGVWIPKKFDGSFGTNGFKLEFQQTGTSQNASGIGADTSGNDNHLAVTNLAATDVTTDTPTNNFATMNPVHVSSYGSAALPTFSEGNLKIGMNSDSSTSSTIAPSKGKWYVEYKQSENTADNQGYPIVGISATLGGTGGDVIGFRTPDSTNYRGQLGTTSVNNAFGSARSANDIFGFYINLDDEILIIHKNGSDYMSSGASSGLDWSGGLTTTNTQTGVYHFYVQNNYGGSPAFTDEVNFGNPPFAISSSNSDANGYGSFEYSPTLSGTAFYAMCTKNLAEFG